jgi:hypothetical protein
MSTTHMNRIRIGQIRWDKRLKMLYMILRLSPEPRKYTNNNWYVTMVLSKTNVYEPLELEEFCETDILSDEVFDEPT